MLVNNGNQLQLCVELACMKVKDLLHYSICLSQLVGVFEESYLCMCRVKLCAVQHVTWMSWCVWTS